MPKRIDRQAHADVGLPAAVRLLASEGLAAVTYRRVALESGLTLSAVRNMWQTQEKLLQRAAISLEERLFRWPADVGSPGSDPAAHLRNGLQAVLPFTPDQVEAHRAWLAIRSAPADSVVRQVSARFEHELQTRVALAVHYADRLAGRGQALHFARQHFEELGPAELNVRAGVALAAVAGLADAMARTQRPVSAEIAGRWIEGLTQSLLD